MKNKTTEFLIGALFVFVMGLACFFSGLWVDDYDVGERVYSEF